MDGANGNTTVLASSFIASGFSSNIRLLSAFMVEDSNVPQSIADTGLVIAYGRFSGVSSTINSLLRSK